MFKLAHNSKFGHAQGKFYAFLQAVLGPKITFPGRFEISQTLAVEMIIWALLNIPAMDFVDKTQNFLIHIIFE